MDIMIPDVIAWILLGGVFGCFIGIVLALALGAPRLVWVGLFGGALCGYLTAWIAKQGHQAAITAPATPAAVAVTPGDLQHVTNTFGKIFDSWAGHSNFVALCFVAGIVVVVWGMIKITKLHVENQRPYYTEPPRRVPELEKPREEYRGNLPVVKRD